MDISIRRLDELPPDINSELLEAAMGEDFSPIQWLIAHWRDGKNRFSLPGEAFYEARIGERLVGICGMNQDPYAESKPKAGRIRRLYVLPEFRRQGVGRKLVKRAIDDARPYFDVVNLRTFDKDSAKFFEAIGFFNEEGDANSTHHMSIEG